MTSLLRPCLALVVVLAASLACRAGDGPEDQVFTRLSEKRLEQILAKENIQFHKKEFKVGDRQMFAHMVTIGLWKGVIINNGNALAFEASFKDRKNNDVTLERVNEWNMKKRFSRAFVDAQGYGVVQCDLDMIGGTTERVIRAWLVMCKITITDFEKYVR